MIKWKLGVNFMVDQISNPAAAAKAYSNMAKGADAPGMDAPNKTSFGDVL